MRDGYTPGEPALSKLILIQHSVFSRPEAQTILSVRGIPGNCYLRHTKVAEIQNILLFHKFSRKQKSSEVGNKCLAKEGFDMMSAMYKLISGISTSP
jgi:hypothetical protein